MPAVVSLRPTVDADLAEMLSEEARADTRCWLGDVSPEWHHRLMASPDAEHLCVVRDGASVGMVVIAGLTGTHRSIEIRRVMIFSAARGRGVGTATMTSTFERAFTGHGAHRVWLDVKSLNIAARNLYRSVGLVVEGELREAMCEPDGSFSSLVVMGLLDREWASQVARPTPLPRSSIDG